MRLTIIPADGAVYVDGEVQSELDLQVVPSDVHALQWNNSSGWIEFVTGVDDIKPANEKIEVLPEWANMCVAAWDAAKIEQSAKLAAAYQAALQQPTGIEAQTL